MAILFNCSLNMVAHYEGIYGRSIHTPRSPRILRAAWEKVTGDGENGLCLSDSPAESAAALQEITETHRVMVHI